MVLKREIKMIDDNKRKLNKAFNQYIENTNDELNPTRLINILDNILKPSSYTISQSHVHAMVDVHGYKIEFNGTNAFFPLHNPIKNRNNMLYHWGLVLNEAEVLIPPYFSLGGIQEHIKKIKLAENNLSKIKAGNDFLNEIYTTETLASIVCDLYPQFSPLSASLEQISETAEAYCLGLHRSAISTLIPCIENAVRELGLKLGVIDSRNISVTFLVKIFNSSIKNYIDNLLFKDYDWKPSDNFIMSFLEESDERITMMTNVREYIKTHLYQDTDKYDGINNLNRHSILHGFMPSYNSSVNYLRLINLLNSICFCMIFSGIDGPILFPNKTEKSMKFGNHLLFCKVISSLRKKYVKKISIHD